MEDTQNVLTRVADRGREAAAGRRSDKRYSIALDVSWKLVRRRRQLDSGIGRTLNISSRGLLIEVDCEPITMGNVELSIKWPALRYDRVALHLIVTGRIVRIERRRIAIKMTERAIVPVRYACRLADG